MDRFNFRSLRGAPKKEFFKVAKIEEEDTANGRVKFPGLHNSRGAQETFTRVTRGPHIRSRMDSDNVVKR